MGALGSGDRSMWLWYLGTDLKEVWRWAKYRQRSFQPAGTAGAKACKGGTMSATFEDQLGRPKKEWEGGDSLNSCGPL